HQKLKVQQPALVNRKDPILLYNVTSTTVQKLYQLGIEVLSDLPYFPDLSPPDFHFFRSLDNFLTLPYFLTFLKRSVFLYTQN
ncbi:Histone-lysine N-methyltransferase SETMAR, partial [Habropoda laboriosa]